MNSASTQDDVILIIGAGVAGLLLAQYLRASGIRFQIFERDTDLVTRGVGWGLTLHWSLPALRRLLPEDLVHRLPETYVDRDAVERGQSSSFPFFDLNTGELKATTPTAPESQRIRVSRDKFRRMLTTGIDIQWGRAATRFRPENGSVTVHFDDGSSSKGRLLIACDGGNSRIRRALFPERQGYKIPIRVMGVKIEYTAEEIEPMRRLDPFFLQGTSSANDTFIYLSVLDAPLNYRGAENDNRYTCQMIVSWPCRDGFLHQTTSIPFPPTNEAGINLIRAFAETWSEPFRSIANSLPEDTEIKCLELYDWLPPKGLHGKGRVLLVGDSFHPMSMYRGEGANHAIIDVLDFVDLVLPFLDPLCSPTSRQYQEANLRAAIDRYEDSVALRTRPAVLTSRQACMDAHEWRRISEESPLLSRRAMRLDYDDSQAD